jgi:L-lactate dehydrogenase
LGLAPEELHQLEEQTREAGYSIMRCKGSSNAGVAFAATAIIQAIARDSHEIIPVSTLVNGFAGVHGVCLSLRARRCRADDRDPTDAR